MSKPQKITIPLSQPNLHSDIELLTMRVQYHTKQVESWNEFFNRTETISIVFQSKDGVKIIDVPNISAGTIPVISEAFQKFTQDCFTYHKHQAEVLQAKLNDLELLANVQGITNDDSNTTTLETDG